MPTKNKIITLAQHQLGYKETGTNITKYWTYFDTDKKHGGAWQWFNTKKQGSAWCAGFICWLFCQVLGPEKARTFLGCPKPADNCAAGVPFLWSYLTKRGWKVDKKSGQAGDIIFFNSNKHVGLIEKVEGGYYKTIEGNKSNAVKRGSYKIGSSTVCGICRPKWSEVDKEPAPAPTPEPTPEPTPTPTPAPAPTKTKYKIKTNSGAPLALRTAPHKSAVCIVWMKNGQTITADKFVKGDAISGNTSWAHATYNGKTGYASAVYLKKA